MQVLLTSTTTTTAICAHKLYMWGFLLFTTIYYTALHTFVHTWSSLFSHLKWRGNRGIRIYYTCDKCDISFLHQSSFHSALHRNAFNKKKVVLHWELIHIFPPKSKRRRWNAMLALQGGSESELATLSLFYYSVLHTKQMSLSYRCVFAEMRR